MPVSILPTRRRGPLAVAGVVLVATVVGGSLAYAAWTATATGSSQARSGTAVSAQVDAVTASAELFPGGSAAVYFTVTNDNDYQVTFTTATFGAVTSSDEVTCPAATVTTSDKTGLTITVPPGQTTATLTLPNAVAMDIGAPDGCAAKVFHVETTLGGASA